MDQKGAKEGLSPGHWHAGLSASLAGVRPAIPTAARGSAIGEQARNSHRHLQRSRAWLGSSALALQSVRGLATGLPAEAEKPVLEVIDFLEHPELA